jgi:hypothetical protein
MAKRKYKNKYTHNLWLYPEDLVNGVWSDYMEILNLPIDTVAFNIKVNVDDVDTKGDND